MNVGYVVCNERQSSLFFSILCPFCKYWKYLDVYIWIIDRLCVLVVRVPGYRSRGPGFDSRRYHIFWEVVGLERVPLSLVRITEELFEWKSNGFGQENHINGRGYSLRWPRDTLYPQKLALTSPTSSGRSIGIVRLRTKGHGVLHMKNNILYKGDRYLWEMALNFGLDASFDYM
jgi:hypothetical protein